MHFAGNQQELIGRECMQEWMDAEWADAEWGDAEWGDAERADAERAKKKRRIPLKCEARGEGMFVGQSRTHTSHVFSRSLFISISLPDYLYLSTSLFQALLESYPAPSLQLKVL